MCVGSGLSSHFLSARPPPRNLVIHPRALSVNKCRRSSLPRSSIWWKAVCGGAAQQGAPPAPPQPLFVTDSSTSEPTNQSENIRMNTWKLIFLFGEGCRFWGSVLRIKCAKKDMNVKKKVFFHINLTLIISLSFQKLSPVRKCLASLCCRSCGCWFNYCVITFVHVLNTIKRRLTGRFHFSALMTLVKADNTTPVKGDP